MDGFFGIGIQELILIAIVALIVLGPERLPATFREIAKFIRQVRNLTNEFTQQFGDDFKALEDLDPRRILQRELASIDEEEQAQGKTTKGKATTSKTTAAKPTTTTAKPTPAKSTTAKTTTTTKPATSISTAKTENTTPGETSATPVTGSVAATAAGATDDTAVTQAPSPEQQASETVAVTKTENQIAPPSLTQTQQEQNEVPSAPVAPLSIHSNGVPPEEATSTASGDGLTTATIAANGAQDHPITQSE